MDFKTHPVLIMYTTPPVINMERFCVSGTPHRFGSSDFTHLDRSVRTALLYFLSTFFVTAKLAVVTLQASILDVPEQHSITHLAERRNVELSLN